MDSLIRHTDLIMTFTNICRKAMLVFGVLLFLTTAATAVGAPGSVNASQFHPGYYAFVPSHDRIPVDVLVSPDFAGVKVRYDWSDIEVGRGVYDFSEIEEDLALLATHDKQLFIQILYVAHTDNSEPKTPEYMWDNPAFGGDSRYYGNYARTVQSGGWYPYFWNENVQKQLFALYEAIGQRFNREPHFEGIALQETAATRFDGFDCSGYRQVLESAAMAARNAFPDKVVLQMMNFACFDLPGFGAWLADRGIGFGTPDTHAFKDPLTDEVYPMFLEHGSKVAVGPDVQWDNYERNNMSVREIRDFAIDATNPWYVFWRIREPYFSEEVMPAVFARKLPAAEAFYSDETAADRKRPKPPGNLR